MMETLSHFTYAVEYQYEEGIWWSEVYSYPDLEVCMRYAGDAQRVSHDIAGTAYRVIEKTITRKILWTGKSG